MNKKLQAISEAAAEDLKAFIAEGEKNILEAWSEAESNAADEETKAKLKLGFAITLDLDKDKMETALTFGIKYKLSKDAEIPNPDQPALPLGKEPTIQIRTASGKLTPEVPLSVAKKAIDFIKRK